MLKDKLHVVYPRAAGLDVHKMQITASVRLCHPEQAEPCGETRVFSALPSGLKQLAKWLQSHQVQAVAMEATGIYWQQPWDVLVEAGFDCRLLQAQHIKQLRGRKTDVGDSRWLARVCQFGLGQDSFVPNRRFRHLRQLSRHRQKLVAKQSQTRNQIHKTIDSCGLRLGGILSDIFGLNGRRILDGVVNQLPKPRMMDSLTAHVQAKYQLIADSLDAQLSDSQRFLLKTQLHELKQNSAHIATAKSYLRAALEVDQKQLDLLCTIPGIDSDSAMTIWIEIGGQLSAFDTVQRFCAWAGVAPGNHQSGGKRRHARVRMGNSALRTQLIECALAASRTKHCQLQGFHKALTVRRGYKRATVATAHKLARIIYAVLRDQKPYRDPKVDYQQLLAKRNAPRWIRQLTKFNIMVAQEDGSFVLNWHQV